MSAKTKRTLAWWFAARDADGKVRLPHGDGREVVTGQTLSVGGEIVACRRGLHASVRALDALQYAPGSVVCRVEVWGDLATETDKIAGRHRRVRWMADADKALRHFACDCAQEACRVANQTDERSLSAIRVARLYADGKATADELDAARDAAMDAARAAARAAARDAARDAARAAARDAARDAAWDAAWAAARAAAWAAAWDAAWDARDKNLTRRLMALRTKEGGKP